MSNTPEHVQRWRGNHYRALEQMARDCGTKEPDGFKLWRKLRLLENEAHAGATACCNGEKFCDFDFHNDEDAWKRFCWSNLQKLAEIFGGKAPEGAFINGDAGGYALKVSEEEARKYPGLHTDWGQYGILGADVS